ncbi:MAG: CBS domain-containing protein [Patescibacteria group bacterium]
MKARDIVKKTGILTAHPDDTLGSAVSKLHSSHDAVFVIDHDGHYRGVINPYHSLIKTGRNQGDTLVKHALFHPPRIVPEDSIERIITMMRDSRMHYLPLMDEDTFVGVISARRILRDMHNNPSYQISVNEALQDKKKPIVSVYADDEITKIRHLFETEDVSKLVVIDKDMKVNGIMSYYDLIPHFIAPSDKPSSNVVRIDDKDMFVHLKVKNVMQSRVHMRKPDDTLQRCVDDIIHREIGSVVIVNRQGYPVGILTVRDLLVRLASEETTQFIELSTNNVSPGNMKVIFDYGPRLERWIEKIKDVERVHMLVKEEKNGGLFKVTLSIFTKKGKPQVYKEEDKDLLKVLQSLNKNR